MRSAILVALLSLAAASAAQAQTLEDRLRSQLAATVSELRNVKAGQADLAAQKAAAEKERDALKAELAAARAQIKTASRPAGPSADDLAKARTEQAAADLTQLNSALAENLRVTQQLAALRADQERRGTELAADAEALGVCRAKHGQLTAVAADLLAAYDHASGAGMILRREPVTGLLRIKAQTTEQAFADRLYDARLDAKPQTPSAAAPAPQSK